MARRDIFLNSCKYGRYLLSLGGVWPYQSEWAIKFFRWLWILQHFSIMLPESIRAIQVRHDLDMVLECVPPLMYNTAAAIKFTNHYIMTDKMKVILDRIMNDWQTITNEDEIAILTAYCASGGFLTSLYFCMALMTMFMFMFLPLSPIALDFISPLNESRPKKALYEVQYFINHQETHFYPILLHAYFTTVFGTAMIIGADILFANYVQHACGMFAVLRHRIETIAIKKGSDEDYFSLEKNNDEMYDALKECILRHKTTLQFSDILANTFSMSFFYHLCVILPLMSITGFLAVIKWGDPDMIRLGMFTIAQMTHLFFNSVPGEKLMDHSLSIYEASYHFLWYKSSRRCRKLVQIMMLRSSIPKKVTAGSLYIMSVDNFVVVVKTAMSFFTMIRSTR